jgi:uncharacterized protein (DUF2336 family)
VEIAQSKGQAHLLAISQRTILEPTLTDVLLDRGDRKVVSNLATNAGAQFSDAGFNTLVKKAEQDDSLQEIIGIRKDLPGDVLRELLRRASAAVQAKILALVPPERRAQIEEVIAKIANNLGKKAEHDYSHADSVVTALASSGQLNEAAVVRFLNEQRQEELIVAIARLSSSPNKVVAELLKGARNDAVLMPCKAAGLGWPTVKSILQERLSGQPAADKIIEVAQADYAKLTVGTAQRTMRFMSIHDTANK